MNISLHIIILAAGDGTRMKSRTPKVLHAVGGQAMIGHVLATAAALSPQAIHVVYNPDAEQVKEACDGLGLNWVAQGKRLGTGHAVQQAMPGIPDDARVLVLYADTPLVPTALLEKLLDSAGEGLAILTMEPAEPGGYGRVLRDADGTVTGIVE